MVAVVGRLFFRALFLFCVATDVAFSRQGNAATDGQGLLNMLGIKPGVPYTPPETDTAEAKASDYMIQLFLKLAKPSGEVINPGAVKGNHVHGFIANDGSSDRNFKFNVTIPEREIVRFAELQLYKVPSTFDTHPNSTATVQITDIHSGKQIASQRVTMETIGWMSFAIPRYIILRWHHGPQRNAGVSVKITAGQNVSSAFRFATRQTNFTLQAILVVHCSNLDRASAFEAMNIPLGKMPMHRRGTRSVHSNHAGKCQIHHLDVYFKDLGWDDWVIAPKMYSAHYCAGTCLESNDFKHMSYHAWIQLQVHQKEPRHAHAPCCAPKHMSSISMLYYGRPGQSTYVLKKMEDFVVKSCICR